jgi:hypothetical protein
VNTSRAKERLRYDTAPQDSLAEALVVMNRMEWSLLSAAATGC